jgi:hypothetical protein
VIEAFKQNKKFTPRDSSGLSCQEFFKEIEKIFDSRLHRELTFSATADKIRHLLECNPQLLYVQKVKSYKLSEQDEIILHFFSYEFVLYNDDDVRIIESDYIYESKCALGLVRSAINDGSHILLQKKIIENH